MSQIIAVDCDEVLVESVQSLISYANDKYNYNRHYDEVKDYFLSRNSNFAISDTEAIQLFDEYFASDVAKNTLPVVWAYEKLSYWKKLWYELVVITARNQKAEQLTTYQINKHYPNLFSDIRFVSHYTEQHIPKSQVCQNIWTSLLIEDNIDYCLDVVACGIPCILIEKPWNISRDNTHKLMTKVSNRSIISDDPQSYFVG